MLTLHFVPFPAAGYMGEQCDQECLDGNWGSGCQMQCDCNGHSCDSKTGTCNCPPAASGQHCENV